MATITLSTTVGNSTLTQILNALNAGSTGATCKLYTGTKPVSPETAITTQTILGTLTCSKPAGTVASKALTFDTIFQDTSADNTGTATWARFADSTGTAVVDVDVSTIGGAGFLQMNTTSIVAGGPISISSCVITV